MTISFRFLQCFPLLPSSHRLRRRVGKFPSSPCLRCSPLIPSFKRTLSPFYYCDMKCETVYFRMNHLLRFTCSCGLVGSEYKRREKREMKLCTLRLTPSLRYFIPCFTFSFRKSVFLSIARAVRAFRTKQCLNQPFELKGGHIRNKIMNHSCIVYVVKQNFRGKERT